MRQGKTGCPKLKFGFEPQWLYDCYLQFLPLSKKMEKAIERALNLGTAPFVKITSETEESFWES